MCLRRNLKLHPEKIQLGRRVEFGGVSVEASRAKGDDQKRVYLSPSEQKLAAFLDLKTPESKVEVQRACGMIAQLKKFCPGVMLSFPLLQSLTAHNKVFTWNEALQAEFDSLKQAMRETIKLSPLDLNKRIFCYTDAAVTVGMCYIIVQKKVEEDDDVDPEHGYLIISCDSTTFRKAQCQYSPFEAELLSISWMCEKEHYNLMAAPMFKIFNDAKNMNAFLKSDLQKIKNPRCFKMVERLLPYSFEVQYREGRKMAIADYGSRSP